MAKAIHLTPHRLSDPIVREGIVGFKKLTEETKLLGYIAGGMGVQSYLPEDLYRETVDLDFSLLWGGGVGEFRQLTIPLRRYLTDKGYHIDFRKKGLTFDLMVTKDNDSLLIQHQRRNKTNFENNKKCLEREVANQRIVSKHGLSYPVLSPEDLATHKLHRIIVFADNFGTDIPQKPEIARLKTSTLALRREITENLEIILPRDIARLRLFYDCLDVLCLANYPGLNKNYFGEAVKDWQDNQTPTINFYKVLEYLGIPLQ